MKQSIDFKDYYDYHKKNYFKNKQIKGGSGSYNDFESLINNGNIVPYFIARFKELFALEKEDDTGTKIAVLSTQYANIYSFEDIFIDIFRHLEIEEYYIIPQLKYAEKAELGRARDEGQANKVDTFSNNLFKGIINIIKFDKLRNYFNIIKNIFKKIPNNENNNDNGDEDEDEGFYLVQFNWNDEITIFLNIITLYNNHLTDGDFKNMIYDALFISTLTQDNKDKLKNQIKLIFSDVN